MIARSLLLCLLLVGCQREKPQPLPEAKPVEPVPPATTTGDKTCDDYLARVAACTKLTAAMRETFAAGGGIWKQAVDEKGAPAKAAAESCAAVAKLADSSLAELGC
jgi:hypothetical protein